jgi:hypothetical protein
MREIDNAEPIYDGSRCIGHVVETRPSRFAAFDVSKRCVGEFPSVKAATDALAASAIKERRADT